MLNKSKHQFIMTNILKDIYSVPELAAVLGFKGGTCAYFFYNLPRFSVDLDFDLISNEAVPEDIKKRIEKILLKHGEIKDMFVKQNTIFFLLSYGKEDHNIKVEISYRTLPYDLTKKFELKEYLGISMLVGKPEYMFAGKLCALLGRSDFAMRDMFDLNFFVSQNWKIDDEVVRCWAGESVGKAFEKAIGKIEEIKDSQLLAGLGELLDDKQKRWVKNNLRQETVFAIKNYLAANHS